MSIDTSKLAAATDAHVKAADLLQSLVAHLSAQNQALIERLKHALAHDPAAANHVEHQTHLVETQKHIDNAAAKLEASAAAMGAVAAANQPGEIPTEAPKTEEAEAA